jgi:transposase
MSRRARRSFTAEFKAEAVALVKQSGKSIGQVARDLDLTETALREWVKKADGERVVRAKTELTEDEHQELLRLRKENQRLQMERDFLKKAAVRSTGQRNGRDLLSLVEVSAWRSSVGQVCRRSRRKSSGGGGGKGSRSARLAARWGSSLAQYTESWPPTVVSRRTSALAVAALLRWRTARRSPVAWSRDYPFEQSQHDFSEPPRR